MNDPIVPFWFTQRQGKAEPAGPDLYRLTAPNLGEAFVLIRRSENGRLSAGLRLAAEGPDVATTEPMYDTAQNAWGAAFELYRIHIVV